MIIGTPTASNANIPLGFVKSMLAVKNYEWIVHEGSSIPMNRNAIFERARVERQDLLFIDSDMVFTPNDVKRMEELLKSYDVVSGICVMGYEGNPPAIFKKIDGSFKTVGNGVHFDMPNEIFEIDACGGAFLGISLKVLNYLTEPFEPILDKKWGQKYGEDVSFCIRAKDNGFKIFCDPSLNIGHIKSVTRYYAKN
jgi:GT2 family glycosyltransferase